MNVIGNPERALDAGFLTGLNWAIISQQHSVSNGHIDSAGVFTGIIVLSGCKYWAIRRTLLDKYREKDVNYADYFVSLQDRDMDTLPGGRDAWFAVVLFPGDILYVARLYSVET